MIKGKERRLYISVANILEATNGGYDIFKYYLGNVGRLMQRPWGKKEKKLSWGIFPREGVWFWKDQATEETGTAIHFVERFFGLDFKQAKDKICWDFGLGGQEINASPVKITWEKPDIEKDFTDIVFTSQPFKKQHHEFWNCVEVEESYCNKYGCYAIKDLAINRRRINVGINEAAFVYISNEERSYKIYFPGRKKGDRFRNNVSYHYLWNYERVQKCDDLIVQKSMKDLIVTSLISPCVIATQAEAVKIFDQNVVDNINKISKSPWIWYGSDWDGVKKCKEITDTNGWKYINTPKNLLPDINDAYGYVKRFGIKSLEEFMRNKNLIK